MIRITKILLSKLYLFLFSTKRRKYATCVCFPLILIAGVNLYYSGTFCFEKVGHVREITTPSGVVVRIERLPDPPHTITHDFTLSRDGKRYAYTSYRCNLLTLISFKQPVSIVVDGKTKTRFKFPLRLFYLFGFPPRPYSAMIFSSDGKHYSYVVPRFSVPRDESTFAFFDGNIVTNHENEKVLQILFDCHGDKIFITTHGSTDTIHTEETTCSYPTSLRLPDITVTMDNQILYALDDEHLICDSKEIPTNRPENDLPSRVTENRNDVIRYVQPGLFDRGILDRYLVQSRKECFGCPVHRETVYERIGLRLVSRDTLTRSADALYVDGVYCGDFSAVMQSQTLEGPFFYENEKPYGVSLCYFGWQGKRLYRIDIKCPYPQNVPAVLVQLL